MPETHPDQHPPWASPSDLARRTGIPRKTIQRLIAAGEIEAVRAGGGSVRQHLVVNVGSFEKWLARARVAPADTALNV